MKNFAGRFKIIVLLSIILFLYAIVSQAAPSGAIGSVTIQDQKVSGMVTDKQGAPIPGVTVSVKNQNRGTVTDTNGKYSISADTDDILVFSFLGFAQREEPISGRLEINVQLKPDITALDAVEINAGYYNTTRRQSTGNISRVTAEDIELQPVVSPIQALQGRMGGVEVIPAGSNPGTASKVRIRGINSLREEGNYPLYIIDGVPVNSTPLETKSIIGHAGIDPLNTLDLSNIQSVEVLKDADATAIYGSRGANGVVLITTKRGRHSQRGIETRIYTGAATVPNRLELLNTEQYLQIRRQAFENDGVAPTETNAPDLISFDQNRYTDWQDVIFGGTSMIRNINLSTVGGNNHTSYRFGGSFFDQGTIYPSDYNYQKVTANLNVHHSSLDDKLTMRLSLNYGLDNSELIGNTDLAFHAFYLPPNAPRLFNDDGSLHWEGWSEAGKDNPFRGYFDSSRTESNNLISNWSITYELLPGLQVKSNFGYTDTETRELIKRPKRSYNPSSWENIENRSSHLNTLRNAWIVEPQVLYNTQIGRGGLDLLIGSTFEESDFSTEGFQGEGYVAESLIGNLTAADRIVNAKGERTKYRYAAIFGRLGIDWQDKYFLNVTGRRDGSSRFGPGKRMANFGAIGGAWIFTEEPYFERLAPFLSFGKIRASYGTTGNDQIGDYGYLDSYEATPGPGGLYPTKLANPYYSWEVNKKLEAAIDLGFFQNRMNIGLSWYKNRSSNQLVGYVLPAHTGFNSIQANLPATVENRGIEVELSTHNFQKKHFQWETFFNLTIPENELIRYPGIEESSYANVYRVGHPLNISLLYKYEGLDPETGFYTVADVDDDGNFDYEDRTVIQDWSREFFGGINNNIQFKNFSVQFLWEFVKQEGRLGLFNAGAMENSRSVVLDDFTGGNELQKISASTQASTAYSRVLQSDLPIVDASFARLKTLSLNYQLPSSALDGTWLQHANIFFTGNNLMTLSSYDGMDPELPIGGTQFAGLRTLTGGIQLQF